MRTYQTLEFNQDRGTAIQVQASGHGISIVQQCSEWNHQENREEVKRVVIDLNTSDAEELAKNLLKSAAFAKESK